MGNNRPRLATILAWTALASALAPALAAQDRGRTTEDAYFRAVGSFFGVAASELAILRDWRLPADEIPVALFVARRSGVSPEAILALRRAEGSWAEVAARYRIGPGTFHVPLAEGASAGLLEGAYRNFRSLPANRWSEIRLSDREVVALVNVRLLAQSLGVAPAEVLRLAQDSRSFVEIYGDLIR